jgi:glycosyltransferase involved in cell wall biosynthesis
MSGSAPLSIAHTEASTGWGGQEIRVLTEAAGFIARGHRVVVYAANGARILAEAPRFGVPAVALPIGTKRPRGARAMIRTLARERLDIVNTHSSTDTWARGDRLPLGSTRGAARVRRWCARHVAIPVPNDALTRWLYRRATQRIVTTGDALRDQLIRDNGVDPQRIDSVPTGIDADRFLPRDRAVARHELALLPQEVPLIGIVATLRSWKGHRFLIDALARLRHRDARLAIVGDGPQRTALEAQTDKLGLRDRVIFAGQRDDVAPWLTALDLFVLPSYANEGVPQALLQAMFAGVPCVTTAAGAIPEIARDGETARVVAVEDADALAAGIDALLDDPAEASRLALRAREFVVPRYGVRMMLDRMDAVFHRAVAEHSEADRP